MNGRTVRTAEKLHDAMRIQWWHLLHAPPPFLTILRALLGWLDGRRGQVALVLGRSYYHVRKDGLAVFSAYHIITGSIDFANGCKALLQVLEEFTHMPTWDR